MGVILCGLTTPAAADFCGQNSDCCEWSVLDGKMTLGADWLYWKVQQDGVIPGTVTVLSDREALIPTVSTHAVRPDFKYDSGFRVKLGYELPCDCWDVNIAYTYLPSHSKAKSFTSGSNLEFFTPVAGLGLIDPFTTFTGKWNLTLNNIDLDIGRSVCFGECLKVRPHVGFRATWFDQKYRSLATVLNTVPEVPVTLVNTSVLKEEFQGYGVEAGLWADYKLGYGVSLVGHFGGSILYSKYKVHNATVTGTLADSQITATGETFFSESFHTGTPTVDYFVGLQYGDNFCDMLFSAYVGWEQHILFDTNRFLSTGNLSTQGLTLGLNVGF